jgi:hypothetical protein
MKPRAAWKAAREAARPAPSPSSVVLRPKRKLHLLVRGRARPTAVPFTISLRPEAVLRLPIQPQLPVAGLVPATHVFRGNRREGVDDRDKPGQGDLELFPGHCTQPNSLNRTWRERERATGAPCRDTHRPRVSQIDAFAADLVHQRGTLAIRAGAVRHGVDKRLCVGENIRLDGR